MKKSPYYGTILQYIAHFAKGMSDKHDNRTHLYYDRHYCYLGAMLYVGYRCSKNNHDTTDFYLGGRKLGPLVTAMSAEASDMSSWLLMGLPGLAYLTGIADAGWTAIGLAIGTYINWRIVAKRIRRYTLVAGNSITLPSFFSNRYRDQRKILQSIGAIFIVIFSYRTQPPDSPHAENCFPACSGLIMLPL